MPRGKNLEPLIVEARGKLYDWFDQLDETAWLEPSLCEGWTIQDVAAHLTIATRASTTEVLRLCIRSRGGFDTAMDFGVRELRSLSPSELMVVLREQHRQVVPLPVLGYESPYVDIVTHAFDVMVPRGQTPELDPNGRRDLLNALSRGPLRRYFPSPSHTHGLQATDADWSSGDISGTADQASTAELVLWYTGRDPRAINPHTVLAPASPRSSLST